MVPAALMGPKVIAFEFDADPGGDVAAANVTSWRVMPEPVAISEPDVELGAPSERPTAHVVGRVTAPALRL